MAILDFSVKVWKKAKIRSLYNQISYLTYPGKGIVEGDCTHNP